MRIVRSTSGMVRRVTWRRIGTAALLTDDVEPAVVVPDLPGPGPLRRPGPRGRRPTAPSRVRWCGSRPRPDRAVRRAGHHRPPRRGGREPCARAAPMPEDAPVTRTVRPACAALTLEPPPAVRLLVCRGPPLEGNCRLLRGERGNPDPPTSRTTTWRSNQMRSHADRGAQVWHTSRNGLWARVSGASHARGGGLCSRASDQLCQAVKAGHAPVAQRKEQWTSNPMVAGSIPAGCLLCCIGTGDLSRFHNT